MHTDTHTDKPTHVALALSLANQAEHTADLLSMAAAADMDDADTVDELVTLADHAGIDIDADELDSTDGWCNIHEAALSSWSGYGVTVDRLVRVTLAGGGPAAELVFTIDGRGDVRGAAIHASDWFTEPHVVSLNDATSSWLADLLSIETIADSWTVDR